MRHMRQHRRIAARAGREAAPCAPCRRAAHTHAARRAQWEELPEMPPKLFFSKAEGAGGEDIAERMVKLDGYLKSLLGTPALALSPPVCAFLDAVDVQSFRAQLKAGAAAPQRFVPAGPI